MSVWVREEGNTNEEKKTMANWISRMPKTSFGETMEGLPGIYLTAIKNRKSKDPTILIWRSLSVLECSVIRQVP